MRGGAVTGFRHAIDVIISTRRGRATGVRGFTLLEVMVAMTILAMGIGVISYANSAAMTQISRVTRMTTASFLMESVVNDIQAYYVKEGFPSNDLEGRGCELPNEFSDVFECSYDLLAMDLEPSQMQELMNVGMEAFTGGMGSLAGGEEGAAAGISGMDVGRMAALAPLFGPMGGEIMSLCDINLSQLMMGITMLSSYMPQIIDQVAQRTRKLTVTLSWRDGPRGQRDFTIETFIVSLPEELIRQARDQEMAREAAEEIQGSVQSSAPSAGGSGGTGGGVGNLLQTLTGTAGAAGGLK